MSVRHRAELVLECDTCHEARVETVVEGSGRVVDARDLFSIADAQGWRGAGLRWTCGECRTRPENHEAAATALVPGDLDEFRRLAGGLTDRPFSWASVPGRVSGRQWLALYWRARGETWKRVGDRIPARTGGPCSTFSGRTLSGGTAAHLHSYGLVRLACERIGADRIEAGELAAAIPAAMRAVAAAAAHLEATRGTNKAPTGGQSMGERSEIGAAWVECPGGCGAFLCRIHGEHAHDCPCPPVEEWLTSPYLEGGEESATSRRRLGARIS